MMDFVDFLKRQEIVAILSDHYDLENRESISIINEIIDDLLQLKNFENDDDIIGNLYEEKKDLIERKVLGEYYTPKVIVKEILDSVGYNSEANIDELKIGDISCGSGSFLVEAVRRLIIRWKKKLNISEVSELHFDDAINIIENVKENITGMDINPIAVILCHLNFYLILFEIIDLIRKNLKEYPLPFFKIKNCSALKVNITEDYDFIVGNPPYLFIRDIPIDQRKMIETKDLETNKGQYDYFQIFIELGVKFLKNQGYLGYIVPDSFLTLSNRRIIRKYLYQTTKIKELHHVGSTFEDPIVSNIILIVQKECDREKRDLNQIIVNFLRSENTHPKKIIQKHVRKWNYDFLIHLDEKDVELLSFLKNNFPTLEDIMNLKEYKIMLFRGVELGKEGKVIYCKTCGKYMPLPRNNYVCFGCNRILEKNTIEKIIHESHGTKNQEEIPYIYSIDHYRVKEYKYIDITKKGINYKDVDHYKERIIIRQMSKNNQICATYTKALSLNSQSFYNLKIIRSPFPEFNNYYLLGLINSKLLSYFFIKSFGSYKKLFPRILIEKIRQLPIIIPDTKEEKEWVTQISYNVQELLKLNKNNIKRYQELQKRIDEIVFGLYHINKSNQGAINATFTHLHPSFSEKKKYQ